MMPTAFKKRAQVSLAVLGMVALFSPMSVLAATAAMTENQAERQAAMDARQAERQAKVTDMQGNRQEAFCSRFSAQVGQIAQNMTERVANLQARVGERKDAHASNRNEREGKLEQERSNEDARRNEMYMKLDGKADTDAEKAAVATFKSTVDKAVDVRRDAVDAAIADFRKAADATLAGRKDASAANADAYKKAISAAVTQAQADCAAGKDPQTIRSTFMASAEAARTKLQSDRTEIERIKGDVQAQLAAKRASLEAAMTQFKSTVAQATTELKKAFGETTPTP